MRIGDEFNFARVSIIPAYNQAQYVAEAIQSVRDQTFADFELMVGDDGSSEGLRAVFAIFRDP